MKKKLIIILLIILSFGFFSCSDYLDRPPLDDIGNDQFWKTKSDLESYIFQFYKNIKVLDYSANGYGATGVFSAEARGSDNAIDATKTAVPLLNGSRILPTSSPGSAPDIYSPSHWFWAEIRNVNVFLDNYIKCGDSFEIYKHILGEAYFFKALYYFDKVKYFGAVPWFVHSLDISSAELYKPRDPQPVVIDSVLSCLDKAITYLNLVKNNTDKNNRLSKEAALVLKSRVALYEGSWEKYHAGTPFVKGVSNPNKYFRIAVDAAEELMTPGKYTVGIYNPTNKPDDYGDLFGQVSYLNNSEVILWKQYSIDLDLGNNLQAFLTTNTDAVSMTFELVQSFLGKDGNPIDYYTIGKTNKGTNFFTQIADICDPRLRKTIWFPNDVMWENENGTKTFKLPSLTLTLRQSNATGFQPRKGVNIKSKGAGAPGATTATSTSETGGIVFRYAEVLLNYAEAKYELGEAVDYNKSINLLRKRAGMPNFKVLNDPTRSRHADFGYPISDELQEIRRERRVELANEGLRLMDLMRWRAHNLFKGKRPLGYPFLFTEFPGKTYDMNADGFLDPYKKGLPSGYGFNPDRDYLEGIPTNEITLNNALVNNPGW